MDLYLKKYQVYLAGWYQFVVNRRDCWALAEVYTLLIDSVVTSVVPTLLPVA